MLLKDDFSICHSEMKLFPFDIGIIIRKMKRPQASIERFDCTRGSENCHRTQSAFKRRTRKRKSGKFSIYQTIKESLKIMAWWKKL